MSINLIESDLDFISVVVNDMVASGFKRGDINREVDYLKINIGQRVIIDNCINSYLIGAPKQFGIKPGGAFFYFCSGKMYYLSAKFTENEWLLYDLATFKEDALALTESEISCLKQMLDVEITRSNPPRFQTPNIRIVNGEK
ncbi:hypothetical protein HZU75_06375 [Chitinibacter fontanus]|uniref:Uncharacterized protein n=1 Tax=Chitinibacter fontanus TaxID=1737446 RepID=A0A7D5ZAZ2_9NEIS|nr:hypothetical protein [Chitinibacter fontanus]QLI81185.1 hypothetical protein HZU75_06375 [Chitinibacter fontanus]